MKRLIIAIFFICSFCMVFAQDNDARCKAFVENFLTTYKQAYEQRKIDYLEKFFSDDALIITGSVINKKLDRFDVKIKNLKIKYNRQSKQELLSSLSRIFSHTGKLSLGISDCKIIENMEYEGLYGVQFLQRLDVNDLPYDEIEGYVFFLLHFKGDEIIPTIHTQSWQAKSKIKDSSEIFSFKNIRIIPINE